MHSRIADTVQTSEEVSEIKLREREAIAKTKTARPRIAFPIIAHWSHEAPDGFVSFNARMGR